jgi:hypothetical protein
VVEVEHVVFEGFARTVGKDSPAWQFEEAGKRVLGGFEVALQADLIPAARGKPGWIGDGSADLGEGLLCACGFHVSVAGAVASLAVDAVGKFRWPACCVVIAVCSSGNLRVGVVAKHAAVGDLAAEAGVLGGVVGGAHLPMALLFRVPGERQFDQIPG